MIVVLAPQPFGHKHFQALDIFLQCLLPLLLLTLAGLLLPVLQVQLVLQVLLGLELVEVVEVLERVVLGLRFLLDFFLPGFVLANVLLLELVVECNDDFFQVLLVEAIAVLLDLVLVNGVHHASNIEFFLQDLVHQQTSRLVFPAHGHSSAEILANPLKRIEIGLECVFPGSQDKNFITPLEVLSEVL